MPSDQTYILPVEPFKTDNSDSISVTDKQATKVVEYRGARAALIAMAPRVGEITADGYKILALNLSPGPVPILTITQEPVTATDFPGNNDGNAFPPDHCTLKPEKDNVPIERHEKWKALTAAQKNAWRNAFSNGDAAEVDKARKLITTNFDVLTDFRKFYELKLAGNDTFPLTYWRYSWTEHESFVPAISDGNKIEVPGGPLASYLGNDLSWRREPDTLDGEEGHWVITREWIGIPFSIVSWSNFLIS